MNLKLKSSEISTAKQIVDLLKSSIVDLCGSDYGNDTLIINKWLENKTEANIRSWIISTNNLSVTAFVDNKVVGFGLSDISGEILLLYVLPGYTTRGIGKSVYLYLEELLINRKISRISAYSTITAKAFYLNMGFKQFDKPIKVGHYDGEFPLEKIICLEQYS